VACTKVVQGEYILGLERGYSWSTSDTLEMLFILPGDMLPTMDSASWRRAELTDSLLKE